MITFGNEDSIARGLAEATARNSLVSIFKFLTTPQIADVQAGTASIDLTAALQSAVSSGEDLYYPAGTYRHDSPLVLLPNAINKWRGAGELTILKVGGAGPAFDYQVSKATEATGGTVAPVDIRDMAFDCGRRARWGLYVPISLAGMFSKLKFVNFLVGAMQGGDPAGGTNAKFYGNKFESFDIRGVMWEDQLNALVSDIPQYGIRLQGDATDSVLNDITIAFVTETGVVLNGGFNTLQHLHAWGPATGTKKLKRAVEVTVGSIIGTVYADHCSETGVYVNPPANSNPNIAITIIDSMHFSSAVPAAGAYVPLTLGANFGSTTLSVGTINARNTNAADPLWKYLGAWRPTNLSIGMMAGNQFTLASGETDGFIRRSFGVRGHGAQPAVVLVDTDLANQRGTLRYSVHGTVRWDFGTNGTAESGSNAGSEIELGFTNDAGSRSVVYGAKRTNGGECFLRGRVQIATTYAGDGSGRLGFFDAAAIARPTGTPADATDLATALALVNSLKAKLISLGLIA